jgi:hypothetical protein
MKGIIRSTARRLPLPVVAVLVSLFSRVDVASKALAPRVQRFRAARWSGLSVFEAFWLSSRPAFAGGASDVEDKHAAEFLLAELPGKISRDTVTLVTGQNRKVGDVLGRITATGKYKIYDNAAVDGSEVAAAILYADCDATAADKACVVINWSAEVNKAKLGWNAQLQAAIDAGLADLLLKGIKGR